MSDVYQEVLQSQKNHQIMYFKINSPILYSYEKDNQVVLIYVLMNKVISRKLHYIETITTYKDILQVLHNKKHMRELFQNKITINHVGQNEIKSKEVDFDYIQDVLPSLEFNMFDKKVPNEIDLDEAIKQIQN